MAVTSGFFDAVYNDGKYDRAYDASDFSQYFSMFVGNGVFANPTNSLQVMANSEPNMGVIVKPGIGWINGYYVKNDADYPLTISPADGSQNRIDAIVLRWSKEGREIKIMVKQGSLGSVAVAPTPQRDDTVHELVLAHIDISKGLSAVTQSQITDKRAVKDLCGWVAGIIDQIDATDLFAQFEDEFQVWFDGIQSQLEGDVATNLIKRIEDVEKGYKEEDAALRESVLRQASDLYALWIKQYYTQGDSYSPDVVGAKSLMFDGFLNKNLVDTEKTTAVVDVNNNIVSFAKEQSNQRPSFASFKTPDVNVIDPGASNIGLVRSALEWDSVTDVGNKQAVSGGGHSIGFHIAFTDNIIATGMSVRVQSNNIKTQGTTYINFFGSYYNRCQVRASYNGSTYEDIFLDGVQSSSTTIYSGTNSTEINAGITKVYKFSKVSGSIQYDLRPIKNLQFAINTANNYFNIVSDDVKINIGIWLNILTDISYDFYSKEKQLGFEASKAILYVSVSNYEKLNIKMQFGEQQVDGVKKSERPDPLFEGYTEYEIEFDIPDGADKHQVYIQNKIPIIGVDPQPAIKRYGLYLM